MALHHLLALARREIPDPAERACSERNTKYQPKRTLPHGMVPGSRNGGITPRGNADRVDPIGVALQHLLALARREIPDPAERACSEQNTKNQPKRSLPHGIVPGARNGGITPRGNTAKTDPTDHATDTTSHTTPHKPRSKGA